MARLQSQKDAPGTSREYETTYILRPNTTNEGVAEVNNRIKAIIEGMGGKIMKVDNWGKRRLAYEVAKERKGIYLYWLYLAKPGVVEETERNLRMLDSVVRYLTVKVDEDVVIDARPTEIDDTSFDKAAQTAADEEDIWRGAEVDKDEDEYDNYLDGNDDKPPAVDPTLADKAAAEKTVAEKVVAEKTVAEKVVAEKVVAEKASEPKDKE